MKAGVSLLIDFFGVVDSTFHDAKHWETLLAQVIELGHLTTINIASHQFDTCHDMSGDERGGATAFALLSESHISVHTWPEYEEVIIDLFTCGSEEHLPAIIDWLKECIPHSRMSLTRLERGISD